MISLSLAAAGGPVERAVKDQEPWAATNLANPTSREPREGSDPSACGRLSAVALRTTEIVMLATRSTRGAQRVRRPFAEIMLAGGANAQH
jgi:hypothetical protein